MAKDEVLYGYSLLDDSRHTVNINDIDRQYSRLHKFYCPHCHNEMYATFGEVQSPHFRHNGDKCQHSKYLHDLAEFVFYEEYLKCLNNGWPFILELRIPTPCNNACVLKDHIDCREHYIHKTVDLTKEYTLISLEKRVDIDDRYRRPDILLESLDGKQLWIEIWVSHETELDKRKDGRIIEIKIDSEKDLDKIKQHKIVQSEGEDLDVRIFNIETDNNDEDYSLENYPCEQYFCFKVGSFGSMAEIVDQIENSIGLDVYYRVILRLNWKGRHDCLAGDTGKQITLDDLRSSCMQRYYSYGEGGPSHLDKSFNSLIVSEWEPAYINPKPRGGATQHRRSLNRPRYQPTLPSDVAHVNIAEMEWIDLGLPSGTLWAKEDVEGTMAFLSAKKTLGVHLPSKIDAEELRENCIREWDDRAYALKLTGPNGNTIYLPCKDSNKTYCLNAFEQGDHQFCQCFHIGPDRHFWINDTESSSDIYVRLVKRRTTQ